MKCSAPGGGDGVAQDGIGVKVKARVTVRSHLDRFVGGATEETYRPHTSAATQPRSVQPRKRAEHLLREFLGRLSSAHLDLDHGSAA